MLVERFGRRGATRTNRLAPVAFGAAACMEDAVERFTAVFEKDGDWWIGYVEELPGANTQGRTLEEARENLKEATRLVIEANRELARRGTEGRNVVREELLVSLG